MSGLPTPMRRKLEGTVKQARGIAEAGARHALEALAVHEPDPYRHMDEAQRALRKNLRAQARQLGDGESRAKRGAYETKHLAEKIAYDQWHRLLFARYLLDNNLLISPEHGVPVSLDDCEELSLSMNLRDAWDVAARFAARELPEIFRADDPAGAVELSINDRNPLIALVNELAVEVFTANDSLGWCYQFWQAERKDEVNATGNKIGADELPSVTQLFTEDYMVDFLLDNTLGAWHAGKVLAASPILAISAQSEDDLRSAVSLPDCPWRYLRFVNDQDGKWAPAAGTFDGWPRAAQALLCLDPCMGSGHFVVALFERLVALRIAEEGLGPAAAVSAVIQDNLFGLEIDSRCTQIAAFNLALTAWRRAGHCPLPPMHLACSGLAPNSAAAEWLALAGSDEKLRNGMERLYRIFESAPVLGSLINPRQSADDLYVANYQELRPLLEKALAQEAKSDNAHEMAVTARGLAKAAEILDGQFTLVATNVPYLGRGKQCDALMTFCDLHHSDAKVDLATCFLERSISFCGKGASIALVTPQNWLFLDNYKALRKRLFKSHTWNCVARLGARAFETIGGEVVSVSLLCITNCPPLNVSTFCGIDVVDLGSPSEKDSALTRKGSLRVHQRSQLGSPDARFSFTADDKVRSKRLGDYVTLHEGMSRGDSGRFDRAFWEMPKIDFQVWSPLLNSAIRPGPFEGREWITMWEQGKGALASSDGARLTGYKAWGKMSIFVARTKDLRAVLGTGEIHAQNGAVLLPNDPSILPALWTFCSSGEFAAAVREFDQKIIVASGAFLAVPFDLARWQNVAAEKYPHGLPRSFSCDPTQWLFSGHPAGADQPLHASVARMLGYQWPRQTGSSFPDCPALPPDGLEDLIDADGIVCLSATRGEAPAAERLRSLLVRALGRFDLRELLAGAGPGDKAGSKSNTLEEWLRNEFFEQHCTLFLHRPFIWQIWDGHKNGFSALVNAHRLDHAALEKLTYAYLGDWLRRQQAAVDAGEAGSDARLAAAKQLQTRLKLILEGEPPFDLFVRWKPLSEQAIGWHPDVNDGVRMNIRPFLAQDIPGGKKGAGILRAKPNIKWEKDRGKEPVRDKKEFPWFWGWDEERVDFAGTGNEPDGNRWNGCHYTTEFKRRARR